jgi:hypothetical protein
MNITRTPNVERSETTARPAVRAADPSAAGGREDGGGPALETKLGALLEGVGADDTRELMRELFAHVSRLLDHIRRVRRELEQDGAAGVVPLLLRRVRVESRHLLTVIETAELRVEDLGDELRDTFDSVAFAMGHELRRVYDVELARLDGPPGAGVPLGAAVRACGLFENCFQQSIITLAQAFDPALTGITIFDDYKVRREQSRRLREELSALGARVKAWEPGDGMLANVSLLRHVRRFRYEHMHLLMYRDWEEFERFADALEDRYESPEEFAESLHSFACYVETLCQQVSLRAVLTNA